MIIITTTVSAASLVWEKSRADINYFSLSLSFLGGKKFPTGYYSYKWAEVLSADAFSAFEEAGLENEGAIKEIGKRFADTVLAMGGGRDPAKVFEDFRGRQPSIDALLKHSGLAEETVAA